MGLKLKKGGGGRLSGVDGTITGYQWTDEFFGEEFEEGTWADGSDKQRPLHFVPSIRVDGADEDITDCLKAGNYDNFKVSKDGLTITAADGGECAINENSQAGKFFASLIEAKFPVDQFGDDDESLNVEPLVGRRFRFGQSAVVGKDGKPVMKLVKKGAHKGKTFPKTSTIVEQVYPSEKTGKGGKTAEPVKGKKGKAEPVEEDNETIATNFLIKVVTANKGKLAKAKLSMALLKEENGLSKHPEREAIRKLLKSDEFLETEDGWGYDAKKEIITVENGD